MNARSLRITWLAPDDLGGGVVSVAQACCRQAARAGHMPTLLLALRPHGTHADEFGGFPLRSLDSEPPYNDIPVRLIRWLRDNPQDVVIFNSCEQADIAIPYVPPSTRVVSAIHDTAERYFDPAVRYEESLDGIIAVSETVARQFRDRLRDVSRLHVVLNGTVMPEDVKPLPSTARGDDLVFLGGDKPLKGAIDCLTLWDRLAQRGFAGRLHWFGTVTDDFRRRIERVAASDRIVIHGRQPRRTIFETAAASKVALVLTRAESFGMATVECMGMGCLPVAWDIPVGTKEIVREGEGFYAKLGDFDALASSVLRAIEEHSMRHAAAMRRARDEFSETAMWQRLDGALKAIVASNPALRPRSGRVPPLYEPPVRLFQRLPEGLRSALRDLAGRWPRLGFALRHFRGR